MFKNLAKDVLAAIDKKIVANHGEDGRRDHLGASLIGNLCERQIWYSFRWALVRTFSARMLRLFNRGHLEEFRFEEWIEPICDQFWALDPRTNKQIRISDFHGFFGGSLDGVIRNPAGYVGDFLAEFKTHSYKSFDKVVLKGVKDAKPEHYTQMQIYLRYNPKLEGALYFAIRKNDDEIHVEYLERDDEWADFYKDRAARIIQAEEPPAPHDKAGPYNFYCKHFCDFQNICDVAGGRLAPAISCRTCRHISVTEDGWYCGLQNVILDGKAQREGCDEYERGF